MTRLLARIRCAMRGHPTSLLIEHPLRSLPAVFFECGRCGRCIGVADERTGAHYATVRQWWDDIRVLPDP